jgi:CRP/FNR family transcriptional regulator, cyclic AMP receptor protein
MSSDLRSVLASAPCFAHFTDADHTLLASCVRSVRAASGTLLVRQNDTSQDAFLIATGHIRIARQTPYGPYHFALLGTGDLFGEANFIDRLGRSGDATCEGDCELIVLSADSILAASQDDTRFQVALYWTFWKSLSGKLRRANEHLLQFFSDGGGPPLASGPPRRGSTGQFEVGLAAKRQLFEEQKLSALEINFLSSLSQAKKVAEGEVIFSEGEAGDRMYIVLEGQVRISKFIPGVGEEALAFLDRGDYFGEMALIDNAPRSADARAHTGGAVVLVIPREVVEGILDIRKVTSLRLLKLLCSMVAKRLREIDEKIIGWFLLSGGTNTTADL